MFNIAVTSFFFALLATLSMSTAALSQQRALFSEAAVLSQSVSLYGAKVAQYQSANTGYNGSVSDAALGLPSYYVKFPGTGNVVSGGRAYVYMSNVAAGVRGYLYRDLAADGAMVGYATGGRLVSPGGADRGTVPAAIPAGSVVLVL
ncbi:hypothetical protein QE400_000008 [Xanthomonas sacchari]|uniref:type IV pilus biogenesis protein PilM n=1 Tax=Xanthomonas sacchari TaxID=56458 RepID=UPI0027886334|nr:type IV pilus biogenesis protein PilM [Xanthomonas sacchari]MDQ1090595.1 hypothetical protein [Xanthomonas sacchari]